MATKKVNNTITTAELIQILGINKDKIKYWKRGKGLPSVKVGKFLQFEPVALHEWLKETGELLLAKKLQKWIGKQGGTPKKVLEAKTAAKKPSSSSSGLEDFHFDFSFDDCESIDIFEVKKMMGALIKEQVNNLANADLAVVAIVTKNLNTLAEGYRKLEASCIEIDEQLGNVVPISEVRKYHGEMMTRVKTDLRALPFAVADELSGMSDPVLISSFLRGRIDDSLRHLSSEISADGILSDG